MISDENGPISTDVERHPWEPYLPVGARVLLLGTFPPPPSRWSMDFYYPNLTNDFWPAMGLIFFGDRRALLCEDGGSYDLLRIKSMLDERGIAVADSGLAVRRLRGNASDKYLEIVETLPLHEVLGRLPCCRAVGATGEKAAGVVAELTGTAVPRMGEFSETGAGLMLWRMPSTSRAYPLALEKKASYYEAMFRAAGVI